MGGWVLTPTFYHMLSFTLRCQRRLSQHMFLACLSNVWPDDDNLTIQRQQVWRGGSSQEPSPRQPSSFSSHTSGSLFLLSWIQPLFPLFLAPPSSSLTNSGEENLGSAIHRYMLIVMYLIFRKLILMRSLWPFLVASQDLHFDSSNDHLNGSQFFPRKISLPPIFFLLVIFLIWIVVGHLGLEYHLNRVPFPNAILHLKPKLSEKDGYMIMYKSYGWDVRLCLCLSFCLCLSSKSSSSSSLVDGAW